MFEKTFARKLKTYAAQPIPSYKLLPTIGAIDRAQIEAVVRDQKMDAVFITRLINTTTIQIEMPGYTTEVPPTPLDGAVSYFKMGKKEVYTPGYQVEHTVAILETRIFESRTGVCVWTCRSDTLISGYLDDLIADFVAAMIHALSGSATDTPVNP